MSQNIITIKYIKPGGSIVTAEVALDINTYGALISVEVLSYSEPLLPAELYELYQFAWLEAEGYTRRLNGVYNYSQVGHYFEDQYKDIDSDQIKANVETELYKKDYWQT